jgi:hypothetical protein
MLQSASSNNDEDDASTGTMPGTPCLNSACGEEFDPNGGMLLILLFGEGTNMTNLTSELFLHFKFINTNNFNFTIFYNSIKKPVNCPFIKTSI